MAQRDLSKGFLISFEGPEGSGKSTQIKLLCKYLRGLDFSVLYLREPGSTLIGEKIRTILLDPRNKKMDIVCEMLLYQAARAQLVKEKVVVALREKKVVILDRFLDATVCYQGTGCRVQAVPVSTRGAWIKLIKQVGRLATYDHQPNLTILLDLPAQQGLRRAKRTDRIERRSLQFHQRVRRGYLSLAKAKPQRIKVVAVNQKIAKTQKLIREVVNKKLFRV